MMGGSDPLTLVLVGKTGNGKSATGNSILGKKSFVSKRSLSGVTGTTQMETTVLEGGQMLNVIDTPGLFDASIDPKFIAKEIVSCVGKSRDGIHAILLVLSACSRFSEEEEGAISKLLKLLGGKIFDYMIVVFTGGDELEEDDKTLEAFLCDCPEALKAILSLCGDRCVLFDNKTKDETKKAHQVQQLLSLVNKVSENNGGEPYTNEIFIEHKKLNNELKEKLESFRRMNKGCTEQEMSARMEQLRDENFKLMTEVVEAKLNVVTLKLQQQLIEERAARLKVEEEAKAAQKNSKADIERLRIKLEEQQAEGEKMRKEDFKKMEEKYGQQWPCVIL